MQYFKNLWNALLFREQPVREMIVTQPYTREQLDELERTFPQPQFHVDKTVTEFAYAQGQHNVVMHLRRVRANKESLYA